MSARRGRLALAAAVALALGLVLAVGAVVQARHARTRTPVCEWSPPEQGDLFVDEENVYLRHPDRIDVWPIRTHSLDRSLPVGENVSVLGTVGEQLLTWRERRIELVSLRTGTLDRAFEEERTGPCDAGAGIVAISSIVGGPGVYGSVSHVAVELRSLADGAVLGRCETDVTGFFPAVLLSPGADLVAVTTWGHPDVSGSPATVVWRVPSCELVARLPVQAIGLTTTGEILAEEPPGFALVRLDGTARRHFGVTAVGKCRGDRVVVSRPAGAGESELGVLDVVDGEPVWSCRHLDMNTAWVRLSATGRTLAVACGSIKVWELDR